MSLTQLTTYMHYTKTLFFTIWYRF